MELQLIYIQPRKEIGITQPEGEATLGGKSVISANLSSSMPPEIAIIRERYLTALFSQSSNETYPTKPYEEYLSEYKFIDQLFEFDAEYELLKPIELEIEAEKGSVSVYNAELGIHGAGETAQEAQKDCVTMLIGVYDGYNKENVKRSEAASALAERLNTYLKKRVN